MIRYRPSKGSQQERLLIEMLQGTVVDPVMAITKLNVLIPSARVAELRRMGWPVRSVEIPHPNPQFQTITAFTLDNHFRRWYAQPANNGGDPAKYPGQDGRGKFADWSVEEFDRGQEFSRA